MSDWISVEDRLPEKYKVVLGWVNNFQSGEGVQMVSMQDKGWHIPHVAGLAAKITHWMPLPEPPEQDNE